MRGTERRAESRRQGRGQQKEKGRLVCRWAGFRRAVSVEENNSHPNNTNTVHDTK